MVCYVAADYDVQVCWSSRTNFTLSRNVGFSARDSVIWWRFRARQRFCRYDVLYRVTVSVYCAKTPGALSQPWPSNVVTCPTGSNLSKVRYSDYSYY